jgi:hypothetical protein
VLCAGMSAKYLGVRARARRSPGQRRRRTRELAGLARGRDVHLVVLSRLLRGPGRQRRWRTCENPKPSSAQGRRCRPQRAHLAPHEPVTTKSTVAPSGAKFSGSAANCVEAPPCRNSTCGQPTEKAKSAHG